MGPKPAAAQNDQREESAGKSGLDSGSQCLKIQLSPWALQDKGRLQKRLNCLKATLNQQGVRGGVHHYHITLAPAPAPTPAALHRQMSGTCWVQAWQPTCPGGRLVTMGTCSCPGLRHGVTKLHEFKYQKFPKKGVVPGVTPLGAGTQNERTFSQNQLINQHYQQGWGGG